MCSSNPILIASCGTLLNALDISIVVRVYPSLRYCSALARHIVVALLLKAYPISLILIYFLSLFTKSLWNIVKIVSEIAIGLYLLTSFFRNIGLNLYSRGICWISSGCYIILLYRSVSDFKNPEWFLTKNLRCIGPIPDIPQLVSFFSLVELRMISDTSFSSIFSNSF